MIKSGLVSVTFRRLTPRQVVDLVAQAGLDGIEWGGDVHVPPGDAAVAREVRTMTADRGLAVAAYGSYYKVGAGACGVGDAQSAPFEQVLDAASELAAPTVRVWAGKVGSADATAEQWDAAIADTRRIGNLAAARGMTVSFEYHRKTLTDTLESALRLLQAAALPSVRTYWQPPLDLTHEDCLRALDGVLPWLTNLHVYQWKSPPLERRLLSEGAARWQSYLRKAAGTGREHFAMLEFVRDDSPESFLKDAATLKSWLSGLA